MNKEIKIFLADDHPVFREGLIKIIQKEKQFKICGFAGNGNEALEIIKTKKPDVAILDISMPGYSGIEIAKYIAENDLPTLPVILTMYNDEEYLEEAMENEVRGYLLKDSTPGEILTCLNTVVGGGYYISKELTDKLLRNKKQQIENNNLKQSINQLTQTEKQILKLLSLNKTSVQISKEMFISFRTVQNHRINISKKLGLCGYNSLLLFAIEHKSFLN